MTDVSRDLPSRMRALNAERASQFAHRDALHAALGSPPIVPSMLEALERAFEGLEEERFDSGRTFAQTQPQVIREQDRFLAEVVEQYDKLAGLIAKINGDVLAQAVERVRANAEIPF